tara:strand:+ start:159 stop:1010 length:852 start_codon:yes stop_codon:yes gene_type:complete
MANRYPLIVSGVIREIEAGDTLVADGLLLSGTTPTLTIGDAGAEDTKIVFDGNAQDFYIGLDDSADDLVIGLGSAVGTTPAISIAENQVVTFSQPPVGIAAATLTGMSVTSTAAELNLLDGVSGLVQADFTKLAAVDATAAELNYLDITTLGTTAASKAVTAASTGVVKFDAATQEKSAALTSGTTVALDLNLATTFTITLAHNIGTFNWTNPAASGAVSSFVLKVTQDGTAGRTIAWPSGVDWAAATAPTLSAAAGNVDVFVFFTSDAGTTWYGFTAGQVLS